MNNENREMMVGETMFDFLKRKKKYLLEKKVQSKEKSFQSSHNRVNDENYDANGRKSDVPQKGSKSKNNKKWFNRESASNTPTRTAFIEEERRPIRSFLQMISPIRSKSPAQNEENRSIKK